jgi:hypothetical protein
MAMWARRGRGRTRTRTRTLRRQDNGGTSCDAFHLPATTAMQEALRPGPMTVAQRTERHTIRGLIDPRKAKR